MKLGVISDTHNFFDPKIPHLFRGVEHILHGGDIGQPELLRQLADLAPVTAVGGNTDEPAWNYPLFQSIELAGRKFLLHHIVNPLNWSNELSEQLARGQPDVVVFGHTHKPYAQQVGGTFFFNPGYAGKSRFGMRRTLALLHCTEDGLEPEYLDL